MVSVTSVTNKYILQPGLLVKHKETLQWLSAAAFWKKELAFFQKLLDQCALNSFDYEKHKKIGHFQSIITYYNGELIDALTSRLHLHEKRLAQMLAYRDETKTEYFKEHDSLMEELESLHNQFMQNKEDLFSFLLMAIQQG